MPMTKGILELEAALNLRSGGADAWAWVLAVVELVEPVRGRSIASGAGEAEVMVVSWSSVALWSGAARTLDALELLRERVRF